MFPTIVFLPEPYNVIYSNGFFHELLIVNMLLLVFPSCTSSLKTSLPRTFMTATKISSSYITVKLPSPNDLSELQSLEKSNNRPPVSVQELIGASISP